MNALRERMAILGIIENDIDESFILGSGSGGQKLNKTNAVVQLKYNGFLIRSKKKVGTVIPIVFSQGVNYVTKCRPV